MATDRMSRVIQGLRKAVLWRDGAGMTDGQLLGCFIERHEEAAFAALVKRHAPMVWGVCGRLLSHHDAEDACQAVFLVLVRKAASVVPREMLANWLYGVARQTALHLRRTSARRRTRERQVTRMPEPALDERPLCHDWQPVLDEELARLPDKYRVAIVLCDLEGKTRKQAARQLGCPEGTLAARLSRGRTLLAKRLTQRGVIASVGGLTAVLSQCAAAASVPPSVVSSIIKAASLLAAGRAVTGLIPVEVAALTEGVLKTMLLTKLKMASAALLVVAALSGSAGLVYRTQAAGQSALRGGTENVDKPKQAAARKDGREEPDAWFEQARLKTAEENLKNARQALADAEMSYFQFAQNSYIREQLLGGGSGSKTDEHFKRAARENMERAKRDLKLAQRNFELAKAATTKKEPEPKREVKDGTLFSELEKVDANEWTITVTRLGTQAGLPRRACVLPAASS